MSSEETREYMKDLVEKIIDKPKEYVTELAKEFLTAKHILPAVCSLFIFPLPSLLSLFYPILVLYFFPFTLSSIPLLSSHTIFSFCPNKPYLISFYTQGFSMPSGPKVPHLVEVAKMVYEGKGKEGKWKGGQAKANS